MRSCNSIAQRFRCVRCAGALIAAAALAAGCASTPPSQGRAGSSPSDVSAAEASGAAQPRRERRRGDYAEIETDEAGFTITEQLRISGAARADYQVASQYLEQGRYAEGIALLRDVIEMAPDITAPHIDLGIAYEKSGDLEAAETALLDAIALTPNHPIALNELGILYRKTGRFQMARESYEKALAVYPGFHYARRNLAVLCDLYLADSSCALENYEAYLQEVVEDDEVSIWVKDLRARATP